MVLAKETEATGMLPENKSTMHKVVLIDMDGGNPETVYEAEDADDAIEWARLWLRDPGRFIVGIVPPR